MRSSGRNRWPCSTPGRLAWIDRKSTRLNSSHRCISYAVFCLKKNDDVDIISAELFPTHLTPYIAFISVQTFTVSGILVSFFLKEGGPPEIFTFPHPSLFPT